MTTVFMAGNDLPARWQGRTHFVILSTGFGRGQDFLATWAAWRADPRRCDRLTCIVIDPCPQPPEASDEASRRLASLWPPMTPGWHHLWLDDTQDSGGQPTHTHQHLQLMLGVGEVDELLPSLMASVDAFCLAGHHTEEGDQAPTPSWVSRLNRLAAPGATAVAESPSQGLLSALSSAQFGCDAAAASANTDAHCKSSSAIASAAFAPRFVPAPPPGGLWPPAAPEQRHALVIGAGLAGCSATWSLAHQGWRVTLLDAAEGPAQGASGNPGGLFHSIVHGEDGLHARAHRAAALATWARVHEALSQGELTGQGQGLLRLDARLDELGAQALLARQPWLAQQARWLGQAEAQALSGLPVPSGGWHFLQAGWLQPSAYARWLLSQAQAWAGAAVQARWSCQVARIHRDEARGLWQALDAQDKPLAEAPSLVLANAWRAQALLDTLPPEQATTPLPMSAVRGQITVLPPVSAPSTPSRIALPRLPVAGSGYVLSLPDGRLLCGATTQHHDDATELRAADHAHNLQQAQRLGALSVDGDAASSIDPHALGGRVGWRATTPDRLPLVGALPWHADRLATSRHARREQVRMLPRERHSIDGQTQGGLYVVSGFGSRGITWAALAGELLAHWVTGSVCPVEAELRDAMDPARFLARQHRQ